LDYPKIGRRSRIAHHNLAYEIKGSKKFRPKAGTLFECAQRWGRSRYRAMILSSEMFEEAEITEIHEAKRRLADARAHEEFRIYIVIRDLVDLMPSSYAQKVRYGFHNHTFDEFFDTRMQTRRVHYFETIQRWGNTFGWETLRVRPLDPSCLVNGDLLDDLLAVCGITAEADKLRLTRTGIQNTAPDWRVLEAMRALSTGRHGLPDSHPLCRKFAKKRGNKEFGLRLGGCAQRAGALRNWHADRGRYLTRAQAQLCYEAYRNSVARLNEKLIDMLPAPASLDDRRFVERQRMPDVSLIPANELRCFYDDLWELLERKKG
jgi:hypothetical protein